MSVQTTVSCFVPMKMLCSGHIFGGCDWIDFFIKSKIEILFVEEYGSAMLYQIFALCGIGAGAIELGRWKAKSTLDRCSSILSFE